jgi:UDP-N-acetylmuramoyl-L-alanyl-D-glutamate--2,6-diaminopimelate ligase
MQLIHLLHQLKYRTSAGDLTQDVRQLQLDSRAVQAGDAFIAVRGVAVDGHNFISKALENGATVIIAEQLPELPTGIIGIEMDNTTEATGWLAANYYGHPSRDLKVIGVTGTNGKTTVATLNWQLHTALGFCCGLIGTVENRIGDTVLSSTHTTPDAIRLQALLRQMADAGCQLVFMEVSSHAVHQRRIAGTYFAGGIFTNLTHDHLDYHGTFAEYRDAKKRFFDDLDKHAFALSNTDDRNGSIMLQNTAAKKYLYGLKKPADFKAKIIENSLNGLHLELDKTEVHVRLIGEFNAYNLCAAYGVARLLDYDKMDTLAALSNLRGAEGRFEYINHPAQPGCIGIVDYAHTPDALEQVLETIQQLKKKTSKVICVVGAGGDRDTTKRPIMAQVGARLSDQLILTSDNPRTEDPAAILRDMEAGLDEVLQRKSLTIADRAQAIRTAVKLAGPNDVILVAGKGHEKYQEINGIKHPFDDLEIIKDAMR